MIFAPAGGQGWSPPASARPGDRRAGRPPHAHHVPHRGDPGDRRHLHGHPQLLRPLHPAGARPHRLEPGHHRVVVVFVLGRLRRRGPGLGRAHRHGGGAASSRCPAVAWRPAAEGTGAAPLWPWRRLRPSAAGGSPARAGDPQPGRSSTSTPSSTPSSPRSSASPAPAFIDKAFRLFQLPQGVFAIAIGTVLFPALSRQAAADADDGVPRRPVHGSAPDLLRDPALRRVLRSSWRVPRCASSTSTAR